MNQFGKMKTLLAFLAVTMALTGSSLIGRDSPELTARKRVAAETQIRILHSAMERFQKDMGRFPTTEESFDALSHAPQKDAARWKGPYLRGEMPFDPWAHPYRYRVPAVKRPSGCDIWSLGPDGIESDDDVGNWKL